MKRDVGLVLFGLGLAIVVTQYQDRVNWIGWFILALGLMLMDPFNLSHRVKKAIYPWRMRRRLRRPKVAILFHETYPVDIREWAATRFGPTDWKQQLREVNLDSTLVSAVSREWERYDIVINPYGERYIEEDPLNLFTLRRIKQYTERGGWFCQVGGAGFYHAWDPEARRSVPLPPEGETGELIAEGDRTFLVPRRLVHAHSLTDTPLWNFFGINTTGADEVIRLPVRQDNGERTIGGNLVPGAAVSAVLEFRSARIETTKAMIPLVHGDFEKRRFYPIVIIPIQLGLLIYGGMDLMGTRDIINPTTGEDSDTLTLNALRLTCHALANMAKNAANRDFPLPMRRTGWEAR